MSKTREREEFIALMVRELPTIAPHQLTATLRRLMRLSAQHCRIQERACSDEAADRDRVPCPGYYAPGQCLCRDYGSGVIEGTDHGTCPRYMVREQRLEKSIAALCRNDLPGCTPVFSGDPRGSTVKLTVPSGRTNDFGGTGICVPQ